MVLPIRRAQGDVQAVGSRPVQSVHIFGVQHRAASERTKRPWIVRWAVDGKQRSRSFQTKAEAERFRSLLFAENRAGVRFDTTTGEPASWLPKDSDAKVYEWARLWLAEQWHEWAPRTRVSAVEALIRFVPLAVAPNATAVPPELRASLSAFLVPDNDATECHPWLREFGLRLSDLDRSVLANVDRQLGFGDDGSVLAPSTAGRYRKVPKACIRRAVELDILAVDPWPPVSRGRSQRKAVRTKRTVDVRRLPDPETMARAIAAIPTHQPGSHAYEVMTAVAYYAGLRPSEVVMLRRRALHLPARGWGRIDVVEADVSFDEPGEPKTGPRSVPIPPVLVEMLRTWIERSALSNDALLFRTRNDKRPTASNWRRAWHRALRAIDHEPLRIYDCRHAAATTWLQAGVPLGEVARRLGHSVETLVSTYVGALAGDEVIANRRTEDALAFRVSDPARGARSGSPPAKASARRGRTGAGVPT